MPSLVWPFRLVAGAQADWRPDLSEGERGERAVTLINPWTLNNETSSVQVAWEELARYFESIYLSWDPGLWPRQQTLHLWVVPFRRLCTQLTDSRCQ